MRRTKETLRLRFESGLGLRQIARSLSISVGTVHDYLQRAEAAGVKWPLPEGFDDNRLDALTNHVRNRRSSGVTRLGAAGAPRKDSVTG